MTADTAASIRARLLSRAKSAGTEFELFLVRYACEQFLYRLGKSAVRDRCILKGASLLALWMAEPLRGTRDVDLLSLGKDDARAVGDVMTAICGVPCPQDGLVFDLGTIRIAPIRDTHRYGGQRARVLALLGSARISLQVDFGFGDIVVPGPEVAQLPSLIEDVPAPVIRAYPQVTVIAEKFETMAQLGAGNSRMKDFHDVWALSEAFPFDGAELQEAVARCFERRGTDLLSKAPDALRPALYSNPRMQEYWTAYGRRGGLATAPPAAFEAVGDRMRTFLGPVLDSIAASETLEGRWPAGGPWQAGPGTDEGGNA